MSKYSARINSLVHNNGRRGHAHTNHTSDGKVGTRKQNQSRNAQSKEHSGRSLLQNVQNIVIGQQRRILHNRSNDTQCHKNQYNHDIQSILQEE